MVKTKRCPMCTKTKPHSEFWPRGNGQPHSRCKPCSAEISRQWRKDNYARCREKRLKQPSNSFEYKKNHSLMSNYNITLKQYREMLASQNNCCAICGVDQMNIKRSFSVDHCHETNKIRGILCDSCNGGLGLLGDTEKTLKKALKYVKAHQKTNT